MRNRECENRTRLSCGERALGLNKCGTSRRDIINEDDGAAADTEEVAAYECVTEIFSTRRTPLVPRLLPGLFGADENIRHVFKRSFGIQPQKLSREKFALIVSALALAARMEWDRDEYIFLVPSRINAIAEFRDDFFKKVFGKNRRETAHIFILKTLECALDRGIAVVKHRMNERKLRLTRARRDSETFIA